MEGDSNLLLFDELGDPGTSWPAMIRLHSSQKCPLLRFSRTFCLTSGRKRKKDFTLDDHFHRDMAQNVFLTAKKTEWIWDQRAICQEEI